MSSSVEIHISTHREWWPVQLVDVSAHGARFHIIDVPTLGTRLRVALPVPCHRLQLTAAVVWNGAPRMAAIEFDPLTREQQVALNAAFLEAEPTDRPSRGAVLLMIDDPALQAAIGNALRSRGYRVLARTTPLDAIQGVVDGPPLRAAIVSAGANDGGLNMLDFLAEECPDVRRAVVVAPDEIAPTRRSSPHLVFTSVCPPHEIESLFLGN